MMNNVRNPIAVANAEPFMPYKIVSGILAARHNPAENAEEISICLSLFDR